MTIIETLFNGITERIQEETLAELMLKHGENVNADQLFPQLERLDFIDLAQLNEIRFKIGYTEENELKDNCPHIYQRVNDGELKKVVDVMWETLFENDAYDLFSEYDDGFNQFLADVDEDLA